MTSRPGYVQLGSSDPLGQKRTCGDDKGISIKHFHFSLSRYISRLVYMPYLHIIYNFQLSAASSHLQCKSPWLHVILTHTVGGKRISIVCLGDYTDMLWVANVSL